MPESTNERVRVIVAMDFSDEIIQQLQEVSPKLLIERYFPEVPNAVWAEAEILYTVDKLPEPAQAPRLRWIQLHTAGVDHIVQAPIIQAEDVDVTTISGIHATPMAEYCLAMMLAFMYKLPLLINLKGKAEWPQDRFTLFSPHSLRGLTVGIVGYGSVGRELARLAAALGMKVLAIKREVMRPAEDQGYREEGTGDPAGEIPERFYPPEAVASMAAECDFLVLTVPLTPATRHAVNEEVLKAMKPSAVVINVARGGVVDEAALISALAAGTIAGAALDVFEEEPLPATSPLWNLENVILSPHISGNSSTYHQRAAALFAENLRRYLDKRPLLNLLNRKRGY